MSLGDLVQHCLGQLVDWLAPWPSAAVIPRRRSTAVHFQSVERRVQRNFEGWRTFAWMNWLSGGDTDFFFFFNAYAEKERGGLGLQSERGETNPFSAGITVTAPTTMHAEERQRECSQRHSEVRAGTLSKPFQAQSVSHRTNWTSFESKRTPRDFPRRLFFYPGPSAAARTAHNGVKQRASFCLGFRSLNTTSSHRMFSMGYRMAKSTQGKTNFQKRIFLANNFGITTRRP